MKEEKVSSTITADQEQEIVHDLIVLGRFDKLIDAIANHSYTITPLMLEMLFRLGHSKVVDKILSLKGNLYSIDIYVSLCANWGKTKTEDFFARNKRFSCIYDKYIGPDILRRNGLFNINTLWEKNDKKTWTALGMQCTVEELRLEDLNKEDRLSVLIHATEYMNKENLLKVFEFLLKVQRSDLLVPCLRASKFFSVEEAKNFFYRNNLEKELYETGHSKLLIDDGKFDILITEKAWNELIYYKHTEKVDWETYYQDALTGKAINFPGDGAEKISVSLDRFVKSAINAERWDILAKYKFRLVLLENKKFAWFWKSFN